MTALTGIRLPDGHIPHPDPLPGPGETVWWPSLGLVAVIQPEGVDQRWSLFKRFQLFSADEDGELTGSLASTEEFHEFMAAFQKARPREAAE